MYPSLAETGGVEAGSIELSRRSSDTGDLACARQEQGAEPRNLHQPGLTPTRGVQLACQAACARAGHADPAAVDPGPTSRVKGRDQVRAA